MLDTKEVSDEGEHFDGNKGESPKLMNMQHHS